MNTRTFLRLSVFSTTAYLWFFIATWKTGRIGPNHNHWAWHTDYASVFGLAYVLSLLVLLGSIGVLVSRKQDRWLSCWGLVTYTVAVVLMESIGTVYE